jgi:integrase
MIEGETVCLGKCALIGRNQMGRISGPHVFEMQFNGPRDFDVILRKAGIPKFNELGQKLANLSFRHTYATLVAEAVGHNPFILKEILGHKRLSTTEVYCHPTAPSILPMLDGVKLFS